MPKKVLPLCLIAIMAALAACSDGAAANVQNLIGLAGNGAVSLDSGEAIAAAEGAYASLSGEQKEKVRNHADLLKARAEYDDLRVKNVIALINSISLTYFKTERIEEAETAYSGLSEELQGRIHNIGVLAAAREANGKLLVQYAIDAINKIGKATLDSAALILDAENAYKLLPPDGQKLVTNYGVLVSARAAYDELKAADDKRLADKKAAEDKLAAEKKAAEQAAAQAERDRIANETVSQKNAVKKAQEYLNYSPFSKKGLVSQLEYEGFSNADASYGAEHSGADWMAQAEKKAKDYLDYSSFSRKGLIGQLEYEGFSRVQAEHGADFVGL
jgi:hypothetical protein